MIRLVKISIISLLFFCLIIGCGRKTTKIEKIDGVTIYTNSQKPANSDFAISFKEEFVIPFIPTTNDTTNRQIYSCLTVTTNSEGKIFVADNYSCNIKVFDEKGNYLKTLGNKGNGPGELTNLASLFIRNDTIYVYDKSKRNITSFNSQGKYLKSIFYDTRMEFVFPVLDNCFVYNTVAGVESKNKVDLLSKLVFSSKKLDPIKTLDSTLTQFNPNQLNPADFIFPFTYDKVGNMFTALISEDKYEIKKFDKTGKLIERIKKSYLKTEIDTLQMEIIRKNSNAGVENKFSKKAYNKAIHGIWIDKTNRLWVLPAKKVTDNCLYFDVFENSIYQNTVKVDFCDTEPSFQMSLNWIFSGKYLFWIDVKNNQIRVFSYN